MSCPGAPGSPKPRETHVFDRVRGKRFLERGRVFLRWEAFAFSRVEKTVPPSRKRFSSRENTSPLEKTVLLSRNRFSTRENASPLEETPLLSRKRFSSRETLLGRGRVPEFLLVFVVFGRFPSVFGRVSYPPGPILESVFLWRCFC